MGLGWKILIPISLGWIMTVAVVRTLRSQGYDGLAVVLIATSSFAGVLLLVYLWRTLRHKQTRPQRLADPPSTAVGAFPVPPIPAKEPADA